MIIKDKQHYFDFFGSVLDLSDKKKPIENDNFDINDFFIDNFAELDTEKRAIYNKAKYDLEFFSTYFFPHLCRASFSSMHKEFFEEYNSNIGKRGILNATAAPRGNAKTTIIITIGNAHCICYKLEKYILILQARFDMAKDIVTSIKTELEDNRELIEIFGYQVTRLWNMDEFMTAGGVYVKAASPESRIRGLLKGGNRPTKICLDDIESEKTTATIEQREKFEKKYQQVIMQLGTVGYTNVEYVGTILHEDSLLSKLLRNPGYTRKLYRSILSFCDEEAVEYWSKWREIYIDLTNDNRQEDARIFFEENEDIMLKGTEVLWPEVESYHDLMVLRIVDGELAFQQEKLNIPYRDDALVFDMENAGYFAFDEDNFTIRKDNGYIVRLDEIKIFSAYLDPALGEGKNNPDYATMIIGGKDTRGYLYVLDAYMTNSEKTEIQMRIYADMLFRWNITKMHFEDNGFQSQLLPALRQEFAKKAIKENTHWSVAISSLTNTKSKISRILSLKPYIANKWIYFNQALPEEFFRQFEVFVPIPDADKDDAPDALEGLMRTIEQI